MPTQSLPPAGPVMAPHAPSGVIGRIVVPPSKSLTQRALVAAVVAPPGSRVIRALDAEDPRLLYQAFQTAGYRLRWRDEVIQAEGRDLPRRGAMTLGNNGTGVRFLLAHMAAQPGEWIVDGSLRLRERPIGPLVDALVKLGAAIEPCDEALTGSAPALWRLPLRVRGRDLAGGSVTLDAAASSQFVSALLLLGPHLPGGLSIRLPAAPPSRPYLALTARVLGAFGGEVSLSGDWREFSVAEGPLVPTEYQVEGDWSASAFPLAAVAVAGGDVEIGGVSRDSLQGDRVILDVLEAAGCRVDAVPGGVRVRGPVTRPVQADLLDAPDLFPALSVVAAVAGGRLSGLAGLAAKESDRLEVMAAHLAAFGFDVARTADTFSAPGGARGVSAPRTPLDPAADHRVAMALAVAGTVVPGVRVADPGCVGKSWAGFWEDWQDLVGHPP